jgi:hypothetical protein
MTEMTMTNYTYNNVPLPAIALLASAKNGSSLQRDIFARWTSAFIYLSTTLSIAYLFSLC